MCLFRCAILHELVSDEVIRNSWQRWKCRIHGWKSLDRVSRERSGRCVFSRKGVGAAAISFFVDVWSRIRAGDGSIPAAATTTLLILLLVGVVVVAIVLKETLS